MNNYFETNIRASIKYVPDESVYRVHYDLDTQICTHKTNSESDISDNYIVVDKEFYNSIDFCGNYRVVDKKLEKLVIEFQVQNKKLSNSKTNFYLRFKTTKNNMIFVIDDHPYLNESDSWGYS